MHTHKLPFESDLIDSITADHPTPFVIYHEEGIRHRVRQLFDAFAWNEGFRQYFAVKATPNPHIIANSFPWHFRVRHRESLGPFGQIGGSSGRVESPEGM